jgi:hypothetical protein
MNFCQVTRHFGFRVASSEARRRSPEIRTTAMYHGGVMVDSRRLAIQRAYYAAPLSTFCKDEVDQIFAKMARENDFDLTGIQRGAWLEQAELLQTYPGWSRNSSISSSTRLAIRW